MKYDNLLKEFVTDIGNFIQTYQDKEGFVDTIAETVSIDTSNIDDEVAKNPARLAWVTSLHSHSKMEESALIHEYDTKKSQVYVAIKKGTYAPALGIPKITEGTIDALIEVDPELYPLKQRLLEVKNLVITTGDMVKAVTHKGNMLQTYAASARKELEARAYIKTNVTHDMGGDK